jgi:glutamate--cysteine ligase
MSFIFEKLKPLVMERQSEIDAWFAGAYSTTEPFFYCSVDLRHSGNKLVPVDTNLFPAGFNNLSTGAKTKATEEIKCLLKRYHPETEKILIVPEGHTRNLFYLENLHVLKTLIENAGYIVRLGGLDIEEKTELESQSGQKLIIEKLCREGNKVCVGEDRFIPDLVIVNNDLTSGAPEILKDIDQLVRPPVGMGWYRRSKTTHFDSYAHVVSEFAHSFNIDPWLISTSYHKCGQVNFKEKQGLECVALGVERVLRRIRGKYEEYGITDEPYVFIKADSGTYGMGIMTARSGDEIMEINKKSRKKMSTIKEGSKNTEVIIQEGVPTIDEIDGKVAEPMMYLIGGKSVGCSFRVNENRDSFGNLNAPGMEFKNACEGDEETLGEENLCLVKDMIARLAALAAVRECYEPGWEI